MHPKEKDANKIVNSIGFDQFDLGLQYLPGIPTKDRQTTDQHIRMTCQKFDTSTDRHDKIQTQH